MTLPHFPNALLTEEDKMDPRLVGERALGRVVLAITGPRMQTDLSPAFYD